MDFAQANALAAQRRFAAMFGAPSAPTLGGGARTQNNPEDIAPYITDPAQKSSALAALGRETLNAVEVAAKVLDYPGAIARGVLAGDPSSGFSWDLDRRVSGRELLEKYGLLSKDSNPYLATAAGLAAEIGLDPLGMFAVAPLKIAGKAAKAAGVLDKASDVATLAMGGGKFAQGAEAARDTLRTGRAAYKWLGDLLPAGRAISRENAVYRPLVGPRTARSSVTLDDLVKSLPQGQTDEALQKIQAFLGKRGLDYDAVKGDTLGGAFGAGYFGLVDDVVANPQWARPMLDTMDYIGQAARWSPAVRYGSSLFSKKVGGEYGALEQLGNMRRTAMEVAEDKITRTLGAEQARLVSNVQLNGEAQRLLGADSLNSPQGRDFLTRLYENAHTRSDLNIKRAIGAPIDQIVDNWNNIRNAVNEQAKALGMPHKRMVDRFGGLWSPRAAREANFGEYGKGASRAANSARTLENESRQLYLQTPGVTVDLREISELPRVKQMLEEGRASKTSIEELGSVIKRYIDTKHGPNAKDPRVVPFKAKVPVLGADGKPVMEQVLDSSGNVVLDAAGQPKMRKKISPNEVISQRQGEKIGRFMMRKNQSLDGIPMFGEHPNVTQARALLNQGRARAHTEHVYESVAEAAIRVMGNSAESIPGTGYKPVGKAIDEISKRIGLTLNSKTGGASRTVRDNLKQYIARATGVQDWATVNLNQYALPEEVFNRLIKVNDFYNSPRAQQNLVWLYDTINTLFKGFALAFPSTKVRDMYSNAFLLTLEAGGNVRDVAYGLRAAKAVVGGRIDEAAALLKELPGYNLATTDAIQQKMVRDISSTGVLESLASSDLLTSNQTGLMNQLVPGSSPISKMDALREFIPDGTRSLGQMAADQFKFRGVPLPFQKQAAAETRNSLLNAAQKFSDYNDTVARLGGMFTLMRQGISADVAAQRITAALVDYGSLTLFERQTLRRLFPWYAYTSRIGKYVAGQLANNPGGGYAQTLRALSVLQRGDEDTYIPEGLRQQFAFRIPDQVKPYLGIPQDTDKTTFLTDIDIPGVDTMSLLGLAPTTFGGVQSTAYNLAQQANPFVKSAMELATGIDTFSRRPLEQAVTPADRIYKYLYKRATGAEAPTGLNPLVRQLINVTPGPWQRLISLGGSMTDERIPLEQRLIKTGFNTLAGMKFRTVDPAWQLNDARRRLSGRLGAFMQDYTESYIPKSALPQVPPELIPDYQLFRTLGRDLQQQRKARSQ
jgi:hypothetical protein